MTGIPPASGPTPDPQAGVDAERPEADLSPSPEAGLGTGWPEAGPPSSPSPSSRAGVDAEWPEARLGRVARLRALAAGLPGAAVQERVIDAPFDELWAFVSDLERSVPAFDRTVARVRIVGRAGEHVRMRAWAPGVPVPLPMDAVLRDGWCVMTSRPTFHVVVMAAEPRADGRTRYAHLEATAIAGPPVARALLWPLRALTHRYLARYHVPGDVDGIERHLAAARTDG
jgi:hypothetical protein